MPLLITWLYSGFVAIIAGLVAFAGRKLVVSTAALLVFMALTVAFILAMQSLASTLAAAVVMPVWLAPIAWFVPSNFLAVFGVLVSAHVTRAAYDLAVAKLKMVNSSS